MTARVSRPEHRRTSQTQRSRCPEEQQFERHERLSVHAGDVEFRSAIVVTARKVFTGALSDRFSRPSVQQMPAPRNRNFTGSKKEASDGRPSEFVGEIRDELNLVGQKPAGPAKFAMFVVRPLLNLGFRRFLSNLRRYTDERYATTSQA